MCPTRTVGQIPCAVRAFRRHRPSLLDAARQVVHNTEYHSAVGLDVDVTVILSLLCNLEPSTHDTVVYCSPNCSYWHYSGTQHGR